MIRLLHEELKKRHAENRMPFFASVRHDSVRFYQRVKIRLGERLRIQGTAVQFNRHFDINCDNIASHNI